MQKPIASYPPTRRGGFTLLELSIVLIVIGLIAGGIFVGADMVKTAAARAQVTQIQRYRAAVNAFHDRYAALPGDFAAAAQYNFAARGNYAGEGDGDGVLQGVSSNTAGVNKGWYETAGETVMFWVDLSQAGLIENKFTAGSATATVAALYPQQATLMSGYFPSARIGNNLYVLVVSENAGKNYFDVSNVTQLAPATSSGTNAAFAVSQAYYMDAKIDDGVPMTGAVTAEYLTSAASGFAWTPGYTGTDTGYANVTPTAVAPSATTCIDNGNTATINFVYSMSQNNGSGLNCSLLFQF